MSKLLHFAPKPKAKPRPIKAAPAGGLTCRIKVTIEREPPKAD